MTTKDVYILAHNPDALRQWVQTHASNLHGCFQKHQYALDLNSFRKSPYAALIGALVGQRIQFSTARKIRSQLYCLLESCSTIPRFSSSHASQVQDYTGFAQEWVTLLQLYLGHYEATASDFSPRHIESLTDTQLLSTGMMPQTLQTIRTVTRNLVQTNDSECPAEQVKDLLKEKGVGPWTIDTALLTMNPYEDRVPRGDRFLFNKLCKWMKWNPKTTKIADLVRLTKEWSPYRGLVTWYLWRDL
jgi:3-methyladenine DNA glycosylase/8-oxoguanine DNA glycosylase